MDSLKIIINKSVIKSLTTNLNSFDIILEELHNWYEREVHNLSDLKKRESKKIKGDYFELLCKLILKEKYPHVWLLHETPKEILDKLSLKKKDYGIDIICSNEKGFTAVQCKYRKRLRSKTNVVTWNMLSTFYALCLRTGPWINYMVMTNADYITHMGKKNFKDISFVLNSFKKITNDEWLKIIGLEERTLTDSKEIKEESKEPKEESKEPKEEPKKELSIEEIRLNRLKFLEKLN